MGQDKMDKEWEELLVKNFEAGVDDVVNELIEEGLIVMAQDGEVLTFPDDDFGDIVLGERQQCEGETCESCQ